MRDTGKSLKKAPNQWFFELLECYVKLALVLEKAYRVKLSGMSVPEADIVCAIAQMTTELRTSSLDMASASQQRAGQFRTSVRKRSPIGERLSRTGAADTTALALIGQGLERHSHRSSRFSTKSAKTVGSSSLRALQPFRP